MKKLAYLQLKTYFWKREKKRLFVKTEKEIIFTKLEASPNKCWRERNIKNLEEKSNFVGHQQKARLFCNIVIIFSTSLWRPSKPVFVQLKLQFLNESLIWKAKKLMMSSDKQRQKISFKFFLHKTTTKTLNQNKPG